MTDILIGVAVLAGLGLFVYAIVREGRRQQRGRSDLFRRFAERRGWDYAEEDDRGLRAVLEEFEGIGHYHSSSRGAVAPTDVVAGRVEEDRVWVFWHSRRITQGDARPFYACLVSGPSFATDPLILRFGAAARAGGLDLYYTGRPERLEIGRPGGPEVHLYEQDGGSGRQLLAGETGRSLAGHVGRLPWPVDLQVRPEAIALYTIGRNLELATLDDLARLTDVTCEVARLLGQQVS